jgi:hypothetical protein
MAVKNVRPIALGVSSIGYGDVGDGVPATTFTPLPLPTKGSVAFNFQDPKEVKLETEGSPDPLYVVLVKDSTDYIEFSIQTPSNSLIKEFKGGDLDATTDKWSEPVNMPDINKSIQMDTEVHNGSKVRYTIVNGKIAAKISQAPGAEQAELLLIRVYKQAAITADGKSNPAFTREVVAATDTATKTVAS